LAVAVKKKTNNPNYFQPSMYVILSSQIRAYLEEYQVKCTYSLTGTEVNTIATKAASTLSNLVKTQALTTADINDTVCPTTCDVVLNLYFLTSIDTTGRDYAETIQNEIVRNVYTKKPGKNRKRCQKDY
jgi:hypothetical protein